MTHDFCWFTSSIGFPDFFSTNGKSRELADFFLKFADAADAGRTYKEAKALFGDLDPAQVETKKAAFQEFGLLYVFPRSNQISLTPAGRQLRAILATPTTRAMRRKMVLELLCACLCRYQFSNPLPVGGHRYRDRTDSTDVLPYAAFYRIILTLDGYVTESELRQVVFGIRTMSQVSEAIQHIQRTRELRRPVDMWAALPDKKGTSENLKIYFVSHATLADNIIVKSDSKVHGFPEPAYQLTREGTEIVKKALQRTAKELGVSIDNIRAREENDLAIYFERRFAQIDMHLKLGIIPAPKVSKVADREVVLSAEEKEDLHQKLSGRKYDEGAKRLVEHHRLEAKRDPRLTKAAKNAFKIKHGRLYCEGCGFDFEAKYGKRGKEYIEAHHRVPLGTLSGVPQLLTISDLAMVCANCHRMLHRNPWISVETLRTLLKVTLE